MRARSGDPAALTGGRGAQLGIFIKGYQALEASRSVDTVLLDKTGTVTTGVMAVAGVQLAAGTGREVLLRRAGAVEDASGHPVAAAISTFAQAGAGTLPQAGGFLVLPGLGACGVFDGDEVTVGREKLFRDHGITIPDDLAACCAGVTRGAVDILSNRVDCS